MDNRLSKKSAQSLEKENWQIESHSKTNVWEKVTIVCSPRFVIVTQMILLSIFLFADDCATQTVPSAPQIQQSRPQAITSPQQLAMMQTMRPRPVMSTPQGFKKPQMTQATVKCYFSNQSIIAWHFNYFLFVLLARLVYNVGSSFVQADSTGDNQSKRQSITNANNFSTKISRSILQTSKVH